MAAPSGNRPRCFFDVSIGGGGGELHLFCPFGIGRRKRRRRSERKKEREKRRRRRWERIGFI